MILWVFESICEKKPNFQLTFTNEFKKAFSGRYLGSAIAPHTRAVPDCLLLLKPDLPPCNGGGVQ